MKTIKLIVLFTLTAALSWAQSNKVEYQPPGGWQERAEWESYQLVQQVLTLEKPGAPVIFEDYVVFTAPSETRRAGVAFAHENFSKVYWFRQLLTPQDPIGAPIPPGKKFPDPYKDSGIQFYVYRIPEDIQELEYRLIISGLWIVDPTHSNTRRDPVSGLIWSVLSLPKRTHLPNPLKGLPDGLNFTYQGPPGETVTLAGDFNNWDPFMYEMREYPKGFYNVTVPLPSGTYQYVFICRGQRFSDLNNPNRVYTRDGSVASLITVP